MRARPTLRLDRMLHVLTKICFFPNQNINFYDKRLKIEKKLSSMSFICFIFLDKNERRINLETSKYSS